MYIESVGREVDAIAEAVRRGGRPLGSTLRDPCGFNPAPGRIAESLQKELKEIAYALVAPGKGRTIQFI